MQDMVQVVEVVIAITMAMSILAIVFGGFKYVVSQGDPMMMEQAKSMIVFNGVGLFIASVAMMFISIFKDTKNIQTTSDASDITNVVGWVVFGALFVGFVYVIFTILSALKEKDKNEKMQVEDAIVEEEKEEVIEQTEEDNFITTIDEIDCDQMREPLVQRFTDVLMKLQQLETEETLSIESAYLVEESIPNDLIELYNDYQTLDETMKLTYEETLLTSLTLIEETLQVIQEEKQKRDTFELEKTIQRIQQKYRS